MDVRKVHDIPHKFVRTKELYLYFKAMNVREV
jgi:hypothetical protein